MGNEEKEKNKTGNRFYTIVCLVLIGVFMLVVVSPVKDNKVQNNTDEAQNENTQEDEYIFYTDYYEKKLKDILEASYGEGTMTCMVHLKKQNDVEYDSSLYGFQSKKAEYQVDGVLVVAKIANEQAMIDIANGVCALFDLPAHKCAVLIQ